MTAPTPVPRVMIAGMMAGMASPEAIADAWRSEREAYREVAAAVARHQAAERWMLALAGARLGTEGRA